MNRAGVVAAAFGGVILFALLSWTLTPDTGGSEDIVAEARRQAAAEKQPAPKPKKTRRTTRNRAATPSSPTSSETSGAVTDTPGRKAFEALEEDFATYVELRIDHDLPDDASPTEVNRALSMALAEKNGMSRQLLLAYREVVDLGEPEWSAQALVRIAEIHDQMALDLDDSPIPAYLSDEQADVYEERIDERINAQQTKAEFALRQATREARQLPADHEVHDVIAERAKPRP